MDKPMTFDLPQPIAAYFAATTPRDTAACFTEDAIVKDERRTHTGREAILSWREEASKINFTQEILKSGAVGDGFLVTCKLSGDFKGSPVELDYAFQLAGDKITALAIS